MAIKLIKKGKREFKIECSLCEALFTYEIHDMIGSAVRCPCCGDFCYHCNRIKEKVEDTE